MADTSGKAEPPKRGKAAGNSRAGRRSPGKAVERPAARTRSVGMGPAVGTGPVVRLGEAVGTGPVAHLAEAVLLKRKTVTPVVSVGDPRLPPHLVSNISGLEMRSLGRDFACLLWVFCQSNKKEGTYSMDALLKMVSTMNLTTKTFEVVH